MTRLLQRAAITAIAALACRGSAFAQQLPKPLSEPLTGREQFLTAAIGAMILCGLASFVLLGRITDRTHVALALFGVLIGGFALLVMFGGVLYDNPVAAAVALLLLVGIFKLMSLFEAGRKAARKDPSEG